MAIYRPVNMSFTHSLAYLYLFMAHHGDRSGFTGSEAEVITVKIAEWNQQYTDSIDSAVQVSVREIDETWRYFLDLTSDEEAAEFAMHAQILRGKLPVAARRAVLNDMVAVAKADGVVTQVEDQIIGVVYRAMEID